MGDSNDGTGLGAEVKTSQASPSIVDENAGARSAGGAPGVAYGVAVIGVLIDD